VCDQGGAGDSFQRASPTNTGKEDEEVGPEPLKRQGTNTDP